MTSQHQFRYLAYTRHVNSFFRGYTYGAGEDSAAGVVFRDTS